MRFKSYAHFHQMSSPAKLMLGEASSPFSYQWLDNVKIHKYTKFEPNIHVPWGLRIMSIFTKRAQPNKMMLGEALSPFFIPVAEQYNVKIHKNTKFEPNIPFGSRFMSITLTDQRFIIDVQQSLVHQKCCYVCRSLDNVDMYDVTSNVAVHSCNVADVVNERF